MYTQQIPFSLQFLASKPVRSGRRVHDNRPGPDRSTSRKVETALDRTLHYLKHCSEITRSALKTVIYCHPISHAEVPRTLTARGEMPLLLELPRDQDGTAMSISTLPGFAISGPSCTRQTTSNGQCSGRSDFPCQVHSSLVQLGIEYVALPLLVFVITLPCAVLAMKFEIVGRDLWPEFVDHAQASFRSGLPSAQESIALADGSAAVWQCARVLPESR